MVALSLLSIGNRKFGERQVEFVVFPKISADQRRIACSRVRAGEVNPQISTTRNQFLAIFQIDLHFHVAELAEVIVAAFLVARPSRNTSLADWSIRCPVTTR